MLVSFVDTGFEVTMEDRDLAAAGDPQLLAITITALIINAAKTPLPKLIPSFPK